VIQSFTWSLYPHLCEVRDNLGEMRQRYFKSLKTIALIIVPMVVLQSSLAQFYVPIVFSSKWLPAIPMLVMICLSAIPRPFAEAASMLLQSVGKGRLDLYWNAIFTTLFIGCLILASMAWPLPCCWCMAPPFRCLASGRTILFSACPVPVWHRKSSLFSLTQLR
jgi:O-antigen/teichoic acid export membrane protein